MLDIVSVFCRRDLEAQYLQARSLSRFLSGADIGRVLYICNDPTLYSSIFDLEKAFTKLLHPHKFRLLTYADFGVHSSSVSADGWTTQQVLKLVAAQVLRAQFYLCLDAKNHFLVPCSVEDFIKDDGLMLAPLQELRRTPQYNSAMQLFNVPEASWPSLGIVNVTPFVLNNSIVVAMIDALERREAKSLCEIFFSGRGLLMEFLVYQAFIAHLGRDLIELYSDSHIVCKTLWHSWVSNSCLFDDCLSRVERGEVTCFGLHWLAAKGLSIEQRYRLARVWVWRGLFESLEDAYAHIDYLVENLSDGDRAYIRALKLRGGGFRRISHVSDTA